MNPLISPSELQRLSDQGDDMVVFDVRFELGAPAKGRQAYLDGHIPGAQFLDVEDDLSDLRKKRLGRHPLPDPICFEAKLRQFGVDGSTMIVAYDGEHSMFASRLWWLLIHFGHSRVRVLNGGIAAWERAGYPLSRTLSKRDTAGNFRVGEGIFKACFHEDMEAYLKKGVPLVDARAPERFSGEVEPIDPVAGHVPGAVNRPFMQNLKSSGEFKVPDEIRAEFGPIIGDGTAMHMCGSGITACHNILALQVAGMDPGILYAPSWSGWIERNHSA